MELRPNKTKEARVCRTKYWREETWAFCSGSPSSVQQSPEQCVSVRQLPESRERIIKKNQREQCQEIAQGQEQCLFPLVRLENSELTRHGVAYS